MIEWDGVDEMSQDVALLAHVVFLQVHGLVTCWVWRAHGERSLRDGKTESLLHPICFWVGGNGTAECHDLTGFVIAIEVENDRWVIETVFM